VIFESSFSRKQMQSKRSLGFVLVLLGWLCCVVINARTHVSPKLGFDYLSIYSSSRCLLDGCNPYSGPEMKAAFLAHGGTLRQVAAVDEPVKGVFAPYYVGYPPTSLFYFMPLAAMPFPVSRQIWRTFSLALYGVTALLFADLCSDYSPLVANFCLACFLAAQWLPIYLLQPTLLSASLCCIGIWSLLRGRFIKAGIFCFALSLVLKPHLGALALLYFLLANPTSRKRSLQVVLVTVLLCIPALLWTSVQPGTKHWTKDYSINVKGVASRGHLSDPGPTGSGNPEQISDLQTIVSLFRNDPAYYNPVVWAFSLILLGIWLYPVLRLPPSREKDMLCLAAILPMSMLPIYHRMYDSLILVAMFPAIAFLLKRAPRWGIAAAGSSVVFAILISRNYRDPFIRWCGSVIQKILSPVLDGKVVTAMLSRSLALWLLVLSVLFLVALYRLPKQLFVEDEEYRLEPAELASITS
jgi:hypothetical protein